MEGNAATEDTTTSAEHDGLVFAVALDGLADRLARQVDDIETIRERTQIMQDEILNHLATQSNRIMYLLAVVATVFLPISFLTGLFGINLGVIPARTCPGGSSRAAWASPPSPGSRSGSSAG